MRVTHKRRERVCHFPGCTAKLRSTCASHPDWTDRHGHIKRHVGRQLGLAPSRPGLVKKQKMICHVWPPVHVWCAVRCAVCAATHHELGFGACPLVQPIPAESPEIQESRQDPFHLLGSDDETVAKTRIPTAPTGFQGPMIVRSKPPA